MWCHLPKLMAAVKNHWRDYRLDPCHDRINTMRDEVELLLVWLARRVAKGAVVKFAAETGAKQQARFAAFDGMGTTDLQGQLYHDVLDKKTVTQLVEGANGDLVAYLTTILSNAKINAYRKYETRVTYVVLTQDLLASEDDAHGHEALEDAVASPDFFSADASRVAEALQCLEQFSKFIEAENLNEKAETVAWALWMAEPLSNDGDTKENKANTDIALAKEIGIPKSTFDRYKQMSKILVERFRQENGW
jgi:hypothetical protein